jgi:hypothetical protein
MEARAASVGMENYETAFLFTSAFAALLAAQISLTDYVAVWAVFWEHRDSIVNRLYVPTAECNRMASVLRDPECLSVRV